MTSTRWSFRAWLSDPGVRACSLAARGLWMDLLSIAADNKGAAHGFVLIGGVVPSATKIARLVGATVDDVERLLAELESNRVFSRDRRGAIYSRRMQKSEKMRQNAQVGVEKKSLKTKEKPDLLKPFGTDGPKPIEKPQQIHARTRVEETNLLSLEQDSLFPDGNRGASSEAPPESVVMQNPPLDPEADYYRRGREVLGANSGGMLTQLIRAKGGNLALARAAIETAATRGDARQYVGAMVRTIRTGGGIGTDWQIGGQQLGYSGMAEVLRRKIAADAAREAEAGDDASLFEP